MQQNRADLNIRVGIIIKRLRRAKGISQVNFSRKVGISQPFLSQVENGQANLRLNLNTLEAMAVALDLEALSSLIIKAEKIPHLQEAIADSTSFLEKLKV